MLDIPIQPIPNQQFTATIDNSLFDISLRAIGNCMYATIIKDGVTVVSGARCVAGYQIIPYRYLEGKTGNFAFITVNNELPFYDQFNTTQSLAYATATELAAIRI